VEEGFASAIAGLKSEPFAGQDNAAVSKATFGLGVSIQY
jgi:hypothetical protein